MSVLSKIDDAIKAIVGDDPAPPDPVDMFIKSLTAYTVGDHGGRTPPPNSKHGVTAGILKRIHRDAGALSASVRRLLEEMGKSYVRIEREMLDLAGRHPGTILEERSEAARQKMLAGAPVGSVESISREKVCADQLARVESAKVVLEKIRADAHALVVPHFLLCETAAKNLLRYEVAASIARCRQYDFPVEVEELHRSLAEAEGFFFRRRSMGWGQSPSAILEELGAPA